MEISVKTVAKIAHEANKAYCESIGDYSQKNWDKTSLEIQESLIQGVIHVINNPDTQPRDSHDNWLSFKRKEGWVYGKEKNIKKKEHPCMVEYEQLPEEQKIKDKLFINIVKTYLPYLECIDPF